MSIKLALRFTLFCLVFAVTVANAAAPKFSISGTGGLSMPSGDFGDKEKFNASSGLSLGGAADYVINSNFAVGVDGTWNSNKHGAEGKTTYYYDPTGIPLGSATYTKDKFTTSQFGLHGKAMIPSTGPLSGYGLLGVGMYNVTEKWEGTIRPSSGPAYADNGKETTDSRTGFKVGAGGEYKVNPQWGVGAEADFNSVSQDKAKVGVSSITYMTVRAMVTAHIGQ